MKPIEFELLVRNAVERAQRQHPVEDMHVELKRQWIDEADTARHLGGLSNAAHGSPVAWVTGVDEGSGEVVSAEAKEIANWWPQVQKHFDGQTPTLLQNLNLDFDGQTVCALLFDTSLAPYVVKTPPGLKVDREVPWREGNRTITAKREHLLKVMVPWIRSPKAEFTSGILELQTAAEPGGSRTICRWNFEGDIFVEQLHDQHTTFAAHLSELSVEVDAAQIDNLGVNSFQVPSSTSGSTYASLNVAGPGYVKIRASRSFYRNHAPPFPRFSLVVRFQSHIPNCERAMDVSCALQTPSSHADGPRILPHCKEMVWAFPDRAERIVMPKPKMSELAAANRAKRS